MNSTDPSTALARRAAPATAVELRTKMDYARALASSGMLPAQYRGKPDNLLWAVEYGQTLGISPIAAITGVHVIDGKPSASAGLIGGLVRSAGHTLRVTGNDESATAQIIRADDRGFVFEATWTIARARQAGLAGKGTWAKYPAAMLKARAITEVARDACEDVLFGLHYTPEELGAQVDEEGAPVAWAVSTPPPAAPPPAPQPDVVDGETEDAPAWEPQPDTAATAAVRDWLADVAAVMSLDDLRTLGAAAKSAGVMQGPVLAAFQRRAGQLEQLAVDEPVDAEVEPEAPPAGDMDPNAAWQQLFVAAGERGLTVDELDDLLVGLYPDVTPGTYSAQQMLDAIGSLPRSQVGAA